MKRAVFVLLIVAIFCGFSACNMGSNGPKTYTVTAEQWDGIFGSQEYRDSVCQNVELSLWDRNSGTTTCIAVSGENFLINDGKEAMNFCVIKENDGIYTYTYDYEDMQWVRSVGVQDNNYYQNRKQLISAYVERTMPELVGKFSEATYNEAEKMYTVTIVNQYEQTLDFECWFEDGKLIRMTFANEEALMKGKLDYIGNCGVGAPDEFVDE